MPTKRSEKVRRPRKEVQKFVDYIDCFLQPLVETIQIQTYVVGGSWRREAPNVGDLDVLVVTESGTFAGLDLSASLRNGWSRYEIEKSGDRIVQGDLVLSQQEGDNNTAATRRQEHRIHLDFWSCKPKAKGAFLMFITGPKALNINQRRIAQAFGLTLSQDGLFDENGEQLDNGTEAGVYSVLGIPWIPVWEREKYAQAHLSRSREVKVRKWLAPSDSGSGTYSVTRTVYEEEALWTCTCMAFKYSKDLPATCKHITRTKMQYRID